MREQQSINPCSEDIKPTLSLSSVNNPKKTILNIRRSIVYFCFALMVTSCYSVRFQVSNGQWEPAETEREDAYEGYNVQTLDTIIKRKLSSGEHYFNIYNCSSGALHTVEYKVDLGGVLLNAITFGRKKKVKLKYVCIKENSM